MVDEEATRCIVSSQPASGIAKAGATDRVMAGRMDAATMVLLAGPTMFLIISDYPEFREWERVSRAHWPYSHAR